MLYDVVLFLHIVGVIMLVIALSFTIGGLLMAQRASDVAGIRSALTFAPIAEKLIPPAMLVILGAGLYLVSQGDAGTWSTGWIDVAFAVFALMAVLGPTVEGRRSVLLHDRAGQTPDGPVTPELERLRRDPVLTHTALFGTSQIIAFLYLMTVKPSLAGAIAACLIGAAVSVPVARLALRPARRAVVAPADASAAQVGQASSELRTS